MREINSTTRREKLGVSIFEFDLQYKYSCEAKNKENMTDEKSGTI
jgi:hypothetical protein